MTDSILAIYAFIALAGFVLVVVAYNEGKMSSLGTLGIVIMFAGLYNLTSITSRQCEVSNPEQAIHARLVETGFATRDNGRLLFVDKQLEYAITGQQSK